MARELPKVYEPQQVENKLYTMWEEKGYFRPQGKDILIVVAVRVASFLKQKIQM